MSDNLHKVIDLNGSHLIEVVGREIIIRREEQRIAMPIKDEKKEFDLETLLQPFTGGQRVIVNSDLFDGIELPIKIRNFEPTFIKRMMIALLVDRLPHIARIIQEYQCAVLMVSQFDPSRNELNAMIGLVGDIPIIFLKINRKVRNKGGKPC